MVQHIVKYFGLVFGLFVFFPAQPLAKSFGNGVLVYQDNLWASKILAEMTVEEKIGQLFMVATYSNRSEAEYRTVESQIQKYNLGGIAFFQGNAIKQAELTNRYQSISKVPLLIGLDAEWGLGMRLNNTYSFPKAITLGATKDPALVEKIGYEIASQCKRIGVHINFAPVADVNSNPQNPVINYRSFGESASTVSELATAYARGHRKAGVMACAKHFPGHGDTNIDSHYGLPVLNHSKNRIDDVEAAPFKALIKDSIAAVMIGHLNVPTLDDRKNYPATVSEKVIKGYLQGDMGFKGLVITDALNMKGLLQSFPVGEAEVQAFKAGNDILLQTANVAKAYDTMLQAFIDGRITEAEIDASVRKILKAKYWAGLHSYKPLNLNTIQSDLHPAQNEILTQEVFNKAITVSRDEHGIVPLRGISTVSIASISVGAEPENLFQSTIGLYGNARSYTLTDKPARSNDWKRIVDEVSQNDVVIVGIHKLRHSEKLDYGVTEETLSMLRDIQRKTKLVVCVFGNPYSLNFFDEFETVVCGFEDQEEAYMAMANVLFGVNGAHGKIPVNTLSAHGKLDYGFDIPGFNRLGFAMPAKVGMDATKLIEINRIVQTAINNEEFPGCQVLIARKGKVVFYEAFGNYRYNYADPVTRQTLYDLASITKVASTIQAVMMLYDQKKIDIDKKLSYYLPELAKSDKENITVKEVLLHQAGLKAFVPFVDYTKDAPSVYLSTDSPHFHKVADNLSVSPVVKDSVFSWIRNTPLIAPAGKRYVYSDLGLILLQKMVERIVGRNLDAFLGVNLYVPMGLDKMGYNPLERINKELIAPTEMTGDFRKTAIQGFVHDPNAALLGGVAGHAGLFSNAWDLAKLMQMNLNGGGYDDHNFFSKPTIDLFTSSQSKISHRGLGWNKPSGEDGSVSNSASDLTFGHTGFTGTAVWVDPKEDLVYVFLSNRVYPSASNQKLIRNRTRQRIHDVAYKAIIK